MNTSGSFSQVSNSRGTPNSNFGHVPAHPLAHSHFIPSQHQPRQSPPNLAQNSYQQNVTSAASAESPVYSSSGSSYPNEESPLPEPPLEAMEPQTQTHVATGNDDYYTYPSTDDIVYNYGYGGTKTLPGYATEDPDIYEQSMAAQMPVSVSMPMSLPWCNGAKKFQSSQTSSAMEPSANSNLQAYIALFDLSPQNPNSPPTPTDINSYQQVAPHSQSGYESALRYAQGQGPQLSALGIAMSSAPIPRHPGYLGSSIMDSSCHGISQGQGRAQLRVQTQLPPQRTVRPAEVSPILVFQELLGEEREEDNGDVVSGSSAERDRRAVKSEEDLEPRGRVNMLAGGAAESDHERDAEGEDEDAEGEEEVVGDDDEYREGDDADVEDDDSEFLPHGGYGRKAKRNLRPRSSTNAKSPRFDPYAAAFAYRSFDKFASESPVGSPAMLPPMSPSSKKPRRHSNALPVPVPVPNLTKKSRGRRVPTVSSATNTTLRGGHAIRANDGAANGRMFACQVANCGKLFARGEHLKRHVRSIHTNEKPHKCPYPGCGKDFSRHDNLGQHMRVHKDFAKLAKEKVLTARPW